MMKIVLLIFIFCSFFSFSQRDTINIELNESSFSLRKCKRILFNDNFGNKFSYPPNHKITKTDSLFIYNKEIINFRIYKNKKLIIQGKKLPEIEAFDTISFYKNNKIIRNEVWVHQYLINDNGVTYAFSDKVTWVSKQFFKHNILYKELIKTIDYRRDKGVCFKIKKKKKYKERNTKCKCKK
jgi:hypothetical protein